MAPRNGVATRIGLAKEHRQGVSHVLERHLADQHVLYQKTRAFHWNLVGGRFDPLHAMFERQYEELAAAIDETAERMRMLDGVAPGAMSELMAVAKLPEERSKLVSGQHALRALLSDHETVIRALREDIANIEEEHDDAGTVDFLTGLLRGHEKTAWMLRSHLEG
jgi:starvation-inducible DNA-binding protein